MDAEQIERFFVYYLEEVRLKYSLKNRIFTVNLDKNHKKLYSQEEDLVCTFDANISKKKNVLLLGIGVFIIDSIIAKYSDEITIAKLILPLNEDNLIELNENLSSLKEHTNYLISEIDDDCTYIQFETNLKSANNNATIKNSVLVTKDCVVDATNLEQGLFEDSKENLSINKSRIEKGLEFANKKNTSVFEDSEKQHYIDMAELKKIQTAHATTQYSELELKESKILNKIELARSNSVSARTFEAKASWNDKLKSYKTKQNELIKKNKTKRENIKKLFDKQIDELSTRELDATVDVKVYAQIQMRYFRIKYDNGNSYFYFPILKRFVEEL